MKRRTFINHTAMASSAMLFSNNLLANSTTEFSVVRLPLTERKFTSSAVEATIIQVKKQIANPELAWLFENCFPNTLDTTVDFEIINGKPDTYVITGDIDAMWLRDSTAQVWPYLPFIKQDIPLKQLIQGVVNRQVKCILLDPYANAFFKDPNRISDWKSDITEMKPGIHERKWEIDSLCYPIRLAHGYWQQTGDLSLFGADWLQAMTLVLQTFKQQQRQFNTGPYKFERVTAAATDTLPLGGYGYPTKYTGLISSMFRPSDDATMLPNLIPSNFFALISLQHLAEILKALNNKSALLTQVKAMHNQLKLALDKHSSVIFQNQKIYAYEVNGFGSYNLMDDANVPCLLSLPYLEAVKTTDPIYQNTRKFVLSSNNPFFFKGKAAEGIGGPHAGMDMIWPLSIIMRGLTSTNDAEIKQCLQTLIKSNAGTGFMHEAFHKNNEKQFTRKWFAWANTLFGELVLKLHNQKPHLLK